jgi:hypothetical protein
VRKDEVEAGIHTKYCAASTISMGVYFVKLKPNQSVRSESLKLFVDITSVCFILLDYAEQVFIIVRSEVLHTKIT